MVKDNGDPMGHLSRATARGALLQSVLELSGRQGLRELNTDDVAEASGVPRERFYDLFANLEDCYATAYEEWAEHFWERLSGHCAGDPVWAARIRAGLEFVVNYVQEEPEIARGAITQAPIAGPRVTIARRRLFERLSRAVDTARRDIDLPRHSPPPATADFIVSGIAWSVEGTLVEGGLEALAGRAADLLFFAVMPYLGEQAAWAERQTMIDRM